MNSIIFFWHIPRTAGTTMNTILKNNFPGNSMLSIYSVEDHEKYRYIDSAVLDKVKLICGHIMPASFNPPMIYDRPARIFTFLRDPVKRLVSEYVFQKTWKHNHLYKYINENNISFKEYLQSKEPLIRFRGRNFICHTLAQDFESGRDMTEIFDIARGCLEKSFCFVGIQEYFDQSLLLLAREIGLRNILYEKQNILKKGLTDQINKDDLALAAEPRKSIFENF